MAGIAIDWPAQGKNIDSLGDKKVTRITDGDTPFVEVSIRMLSIDTPEVHYPGRAKPSKHDAKLEQLADWIEEGKAPIDDGLADFLHPKLKTGTAGTLQLQQGEAATQEFERLLDERVTRKSRKVFVRAADEKFDHYGRLLAYIAPRFKKKELANMTPLQRATFNLLLVRSGWAATFVIFPSLPKKADLRLLHREARKAIDKKKGAWADKNTLTGYEFRSVYPLWDITNKMVVKNQTLTTSEQFSWISRFCVDMTTLEMFDPQNYYKVPAANRLFIWQADRHAAIETLDLDFVG